MFHESSNLGLRSQSGCATPVTECQRPVAPAGALDERKRQMNSASVRTEPYCYLGMLGGCAGANDDAEI